MSKKHKKTPIEQLVHEEFAKHDLPEDNSGSSYYERTEKEKNKQIITDQGVTLHIGSRSITEIGSRPRKKYLSDADEETKKLFQSSLKPRHYPDKVLLLIKDHKSEIERLWNYIWDKEFLNRENIENYNIVGFCFYCKKWAKKNPHSPFNENFFDHYRKVLFNPQKKGEFKDGIDHDHIKRDFIGKLLQASISSNFPNIFPESRLYSQPPDGYSAKRLSELFNYFQ